MAETITITAPISRPSITDYKPVSLQIIIYPSSEIIIMLISSIGELVKFTYPSAPGTQFDTPDKVANLIANLNTANLSIRSLWRRIFDRLLIDFPEQFLGGAIVS